MDMLIICIWIELPISSPLHTKPSVCVAKFISVSCGWLLANCILEVTCTSIWRRAQITSTYEHTYRSPPPIEFLLLCVTEIQFNTLSMCSFSRLILANKHSSPMMCESSEACTGTVSVTSNFVFFNQQFHLDLGSRPERLWEFVKTIQSIEDGAFYNGSFLLPMFHLHSRPPTNLLLPNQTHQNQVYLCVIVCILVFEHVPRTFLSSSGPETQVLDYQTQQYKLLPLLSVAYALNMAGVYMFRLYLTCRSEIAEGNLESMPEVAKTSVYCYNIIEGLHKRTQRFYITITQAQD